MLTMAIRMDNNSFLKKKINTFFSFSVLQINTLILGQAAAKWIWGGGHVSFRV